MAFLPPEDSENLLIKQQAEIADLRGRLATAEALLRDQQIQPTTQNDPLRIHERQAVLILDEMHHFVALIDAQGHVLECSQTVFNVRQTRREDFIGRTLWEVPRWTTATRNNLYATFQRTLTTGMFVSLEVELFVADSGTDVLIIDMGFKPIRNEQGEVAFLIIEGRDITAKKRAEAEVLRQNIELQTLYEQAYKLDQIKSLFFAMMNHELRTPLTLILGPTESLLQHASLTQEVRQSLEVVNRNGRLLLKIVNDLLEVSRLEAGQLQLNYLSCDLSRLVHLLAANFETVATERRLTYRIQTPPHLIAEVDTTQIERVLLNLLSNAFKFTPDGGSITCCLEMQLADQSASAPSQSVLLTVQDSGPGIPLELREMIFERFRQTEEGAKRRFGGTGLGLAIVKDLVELHHGTIQIDEAPGGGARFLIRLPQHAPEGTNVQEEGASALSEPSDARLSQTMVEELLPVQSPPSPSPSRASTTNETALILIVEDHPQMRQFISEQLSSQYRVVEATNGQEGLALARQMHPDLILTDMMMPIMSGDEMLITLRADPDCEDIPVVVLSGRGNETHRLSMLRAGAQDYLVKPFSSEELQVRLGNLLMLHRTRRLLQQELASSQKNVESLAHALTVRLRDLEALNTELHHMNKQQSDFVAVVSHEFRTTLTGIQGFSELLCEQEWSFEQVKEYATDITTDAKRLTRMINEVLDLERMKSGKTILRIEPVDINVLLRTRVEQMQQITSKHPIVCILDETLPLVQGDQDQLIQVITNLLSNAVKYSPDGGTIVLKSQHEQDAVQISIQDQGIGIPEEAQKNIFVPYNRIASEQTRYIAGTGLGLAVVYESIHLHGGAIWVESIVGHGSTFHISLPLKQELTLSFPLQQSPEVQSQQ
jgi:PAS domain S-box-containing protein